MIKRVHNVIKKVKINKYNKTINQYIKIDYTNKSNDDLKVILLETEKTDEKLAVISELSHRFFGLRPFKSQIKGSLVLLDSNIAEMKTGEGKTLSVIITLILNYLEKKNAHVITANDYLVERDYEFSKPLFDFLGIKTAHLYDNQDFAEKQQSYDADIIYSTSRILVFDYLNNNRFNDERYLFNDKRDFVIIDEVDFVLIDEARTPINLSGILETNREIFQLFQLIQSHFIVTRKSDDFNPEIDPDIILNNNMIEITEKGYTLLEKKLIESGVIKQAKELYGQNGVKYIKSLELAINANHVLKEDVDYLKEDGDIVIVNPQTGRPQKGRRFSDGVHQALEAKEGFEIQNDAKTLAQTTLQNYLRKYKKISGTTGTAITEELEFREFYNLTVYEIETNKKMIRNDSDDLIFMNKTAMYKSLIIDVKENIENGRPTLIGTQSVSESENIAKQLKVNGISFNLLNAKNHEKEAYIIQQAGKAGIVTIATNMAGRGTDIMLGGNKEIEIENYLLENALKEKEDAIRNWEKDHNEIVAAGGLSVIGVERSASRRFDNQLIGRSGRQGDPGSTKYYLTLDDELFAHISKSIISMGWNKDNTEVGIASPVLTRTIREAQKTYENAGFNMRKTLLSFDNINTEQREIFYAWRSRIVKSNDLKEKTTTTMLNDVIKNLISSNITNETFLANDFNAIDEDFLKDLGIQIETKEICSNPDSKIEDEEDLIEYICKNLGNNINEKMSILNDEDIQIIEKDLLLRTMDELWADNISNLEQMRMNTNLRTYAQKNPIDEYQQEALEMFGNLIKDVKKDYINIIIKFSPMAMLKQQEQMEETKRNALNSQGSIESEFDAEKDYGLSKYIENVGI